MTSPPSLSTATPIGNTGAPVHIPGKRRLTLLALACLIFFTTSGGAYGLEPLVGAVGPGWAIVLILITPVIWSFPIALMVAELASVIPEEGGYYIWVRETLGPFWGVQEAWWTMCYTVVLLASFAVAFASYLAFFIPALAPAADAPNSVSGGLIRWSIAALVVVSAMVVNLRGARDVGRSAEASTVFVLGGFALLFFVWLKGGPGPGAVVDVVTGDLATNQRGALLLGLSIIVFNYSGWDNASCYAGEVDHPQSNYPKAIALALAAVVLGYLLPVLAGITVTTDPSIWNMGAGWPVIGRLIGGRWLGSLIAAGGLVSMWALFNAQLLYVSRLPFVMARDKWLPDVMARVSPDTGVPKVAILCFCAVTLLFTAFSFGSLAVIVALLNTAALFLEFLALIVLRVRRPEAIRAFRVPGGWWGMAYVCLTWLTAATVVLIATLREWRSFPVQLIVVGGLGLSGVVLYFARRRIALPRIDQS